MAQEYKNWDHAFTRGAIEACRAKYWVSNVVGLTAGELTEDTLSWRFGYDQPKIKEARFCVYEAEDFQDWQLFRVSLKGLDTAEKLLMLMNRWCDFECSAEGKNRLAEWEQFDRSTIEYVRIMNYIGALRRGGQLNQKLEIVK